MRYPLPHTFRPVVPSQAVASGLLAAGSREVDTAVGVFGTVLPTSWSSVAAAGYRRRVEGLVRSAQRLSGLLEVGAGAARLHEQEIEATRSALAGGGPMPV